MESDRLESDKHFDKGFHTPTSLALAFVVAAAVEQAMASLECLAPRVECTDSTLSCIAAVGVDSTSQLTTRWQSWRAAVNGLDPTPCSRTKIPRPCLRSYLRRILLTWKTFPSVLSWALPNLFRRLDNSIWQEVHKFSQILPFTEWKEEKISKHAQNRLGWISK